MAKVWRCSKDVDFPLGRVCPLGYGESVTFFRSYQIIHIRPRYSKLAQHDIGTFFVVHNFLEKFHKIVRNFIVILPPRSIISFSPTTQLPYASRKIARNLARVEPATAYLLMFVICICLGLGTAKIAIYRRVPGSAFLWFIAGTIFAFIALPLAIFSKPVRKSSSAKISLRADLGNTRSAQRREDEN